MRAPTLRYWLAKALLHAAMLCNKAADKLVDATDWVYPTEGK